MTSRRADDTQPDGRNFGKCVRLQRALVTVPAGVELIQNLSKLTRIFEAQTAQRSQIVTHFTRVNSSDSFVHCTA